MRALLVAAILLLPSAAHADISSLIDEATVTLREIGPHVPDSWRTTADCVSVFKMGKGGFIIGGTGGVGFMSCKTAQGVWTAPIVLQIGGTSVGPQIGGGSVEIVMVYRNVDSVAAAAHATPVFAAKAEAVVGDKSKGISIGGNPEVDAGVLTFSRSKGLYAGGTLEAVVVDPSAEKTAELYGAAIDIEATLVSGSTAVPAKAKAFHDTVRAWAAGK